MRFVGKDDINDMLIENNTSLEFCSVKNEDEWRIEIVKELLDARNKQVILNSLDNEEISSILLHVLCIS